MLLRLDAKQIPIVLAIFLLTQPRSTLEMPERETGYKFDCTLLKSAWVSGSEGAENSRLPIAYGDLGLGAISYICIQ